MPWVTSNPYVSSDRSLVSQFEDGKVVEKGTVGEILLVAYWAEEPNGGAVEIGLTALRFNEAAAAGRDQVSPGVTFHRSSQGAAAPRACPGGEPRLGPATASSSAGTCRIPRSRSSALRRRRASRNPLPKGRDGRAGP